MLRFLFLCLILAASVGDFGVADRVGDASFTVTPNKDITDKSTEGSAFEGDDETDDAETVASEYEKDTRLESSINEQKDEEEGSSTIIIIAAVSVIALAVVAATAIFLFRRHLQSREQGVYSVPAEQEQKAVV